MKPRVFISSTYYDLKFIRNDLEKFIRQFGFEPILFESGNITYMHEKAIDESCYNEVKQCNMMILIIGGRYGTPSTDQEQSEAIKKYEKTYISITRNEFRTARDNNVPIYIFVDKNVHSEYQTYSKNKTFFQEIAMSQESDPFEFYSFTFAHVDNINVFEFIDEVKYKPIQPFEKFTDIENYLKEQWSGMFYQYLSEIKEKKTRENILNEVAELKNISERMNNMLNEVGKKVIGNNEEYEYIIQKQNFKLLDLLAERIADRILFVTGPNTKISSIVWEKLVNVLIDVFLNDKEIQTWLDHDYPGHQNDFSDFLYNFTENINNLIGNIIKGFQIVSLDLNAYCIYQNDIKSLIIESKELEAYFHKKLVDIFCERGNKFSFTETIDNFT